jgi:hypothetical protein
VRADLDRADLSAVHDKQGQPSGNVSQDCNAGGMMLIRHRSFALSGLFSVTAPPLEEVSHRHFERKRKLVQRTSGYAVDRPLVFLKLLERDAERVGNHLLGQARFLPPQEHARCDMAIDRVGKTVRHNQRRLDEEKAPIAAGV